MTSPRKASKGRWLDRILAGQDLFTMSEVSEMVGVSVATLRRHRNAEGVKAPSKKYTRGGYTAYLYTPDDVRELTEYFRRCSLVTTN